MFELNKYYTRDEINKCVGGSKQWYLPTVKGQVVAVCLKKSLNNDAPQYVICGKGKIVASAGKKLSNQKEPLPVFIKLDKNCWEYKGMHKVKTSFSSGEKFNNLVMASSRNLSGISIVVELLKIKQRKSHNLPKNENIQITPH